MWAILKYDKKYLGLLQSELIQKLGSNTKFYLPKFKFQTLKKNKLHDKVFYLLGDYLLCNSPELKNQNIIHEINFCKGLKYFLNINIYSQNEINNFVKKCIINEDKDGYITQTFFVLRKNKNFKFLSGPFANMIFKIIQFNYSKIKILMGKYETEVNIKKYIFSPA